MIVYRAATPRDGAELSMMAQRCFTETFGTLYRAADLAAFLDATFGAGGLPSQLSDPRLFDFLALGARGGALPDAHAWLDGGEPEAGSREPESHDA